jgi:uncharacterized membrane protein YagU involved in acid resistance
VETLWTFQLTSWQQKSSRNTKKLFGPVSWDLQAEIIKTAINTFYSHNFQFIHFKSKWLPP